MKAKREQAKQLYQAILNAVSDVDFKQDGDETDHIRFHHNIDLAVAEIQKKAGKDQELAALLKEFKIDPGRDDIQYPPLAEAVALRRRKKFGFESYMDCLKDGCAAVGGEWHASIDSYGCKFPNGMSTAEKVSMAIAYSWVFQECNPVISLVGRILDAIF